MPQLLQEKALQDVELSIYGDELGKCKINTNLTADDAMQVVEDHPETTKDNKAQMAWLIAAAIEEWNFTDAENKPLPITGDNVRKLKMVDYVMLGNILEIDRFALGTGKKKPSPVI